MSIEFHACRTGMHSFQQVFFHAMNIWVNLNLSQTESNQQINNNLVYKGAVDEVTAKLGLPIQWFRNEIGQFLFLSNPCCK